MADEKEEIKQEITPSQYFESLNEAKKTITTEALKESYGVFVTLGQKYVKTGQVESLKKLRFLADAFTKEEKLIEMGINTYVYKDVVEDYITTVADKTVKIVELSRYMREIPDEIVETIEKTRGVFNQFYVVFTDYTGKEERKVEKERRDKDPILFGVFKNNTTISDRFYFLGDWVDEFCDLTLDKMVEQYKEKKGVSPLTVTEIPKTAEELVALLKTFKIEEDKEGQPNGFVLSPETPFAVPVSSYKVDPKVEKEPGFFEKIRSIFTKK